MYHQYAYNNQVDAHIAFIKDPNLKKEKQNLQAPYNYYQYQQIGTKRLCLLQSEFPVEIFSIMPKLFVITANNNIPHNFNIAMIKDTSQLISRLLANDTECLEYHLEFDDDLNILEKFEKIFRGEEETLNDDEFQLLRKMTKSLEMENSINFYKSTLFSTHKEMTVGINFPQFISYLKYGAPQTFVIKTHKKQYKCNIFGVYSSQILCDLLLKDPKIDSYEYDFDDELDEFQLICDLFNFKDIKITSNNMNSLNDIINDLQITYLIEKINDFVEDYQKVSKTIDDEQIIVDSIEEVFNWLYKIKDLNVETVKNLLLESNWISTEENVQELTAFLLQVINCDSTYHPYLIELIIELDKEANETNSLKILMPFIIRKLFFSFGESLLNCSFVYKLFKKGFVEQNLLKKNFIKVFNPDNHNRSKAKRMFDTYDNNKKLDNLICWFYPELKEIDEIKDKIVMRKGESISRFIDSYFPENVENYNRMRDNGEPDDELTIALRYDDIDTLQSIIIKNGLLYDSNNQQRSKGFTSFMSSFTNQKNLLNASVPFNLYENFVSNGNINYIDYSAAYGSLKCFKYLLLNHAQINESTFDYAVFGGNIEIIKIVNQNVKKIDNSNEKISYYYMNKNERNDQRFPSIIKHQNDIFNWVFQERYEGKQTNDNLISKLLLSSAANGNAHALIEIIDKGYNFLCNSHEIIRLCSRNGFYLYTKLFISIMKSKKNDLYLDYSSSVYFGNLSIFKLFHESMKSHYDLRSAISLAIEYNYNNIIQYFFQVLIKEDFQVTQDIVYSCLSSSITVNNNDIFNYLIEQFKIENPNIFNHFKKLNQLLSKACLLGNIEVAKIITDLIINDNPKDDFTTPFFNAAISGKIEICNYLIEKKLFINFENLSYQVLKLSSIKEEIFSLMIENADQESKEIFFNIYLEQAIMKNNKGLIKYLIQKGASCVNSLFNAINTHDIELVNLILEYNNKPSFINKRSKDGTALYISVKNNDLELVRRLLLVPGINPSLYEGDNKTPLILAVFNLNLDIVNEILNFYGDNIQYETKQINEAFQHIFKVISSSNKGPYTYFYNEVPYDVRSSTGWNSCQVSSQMKNLNTRPKVTSILKRLLEIKTIDPNYRCNNTTILFYACLNNDIEIVQMLLNLDKTDLNLYSLVTGDSPLMVSIDKNNLEIAELLIKDPRMNINMKNFMNQTALTMSVSKNLDKIVDLLINNENFDSEESCINYAFFISTGDISKKLITSEKLDVNYKISKEEKEKENESQIDRDIQEIRRERLEFCEPNEIRSYTTTLIDAIYVNDPEKVDLIIHHPSFNQAKSQLKRAIFASVEKDRLEIFQKLIQLVNDDVNIFNCNNESLLYVSVVNKSKEVLSAILNNSKFDASKSDLLNAFIQTINKNNDDSVSIMNKLYDYDSKHDHFIDFSKLLPNGKSFFTSIASNYLFDNEDEDVDDFIVIVPDLSGVEGIVNFLLDHGVDPNEKDKDDFSPFEYAILLNSSEFVHSLIHSNKVDFSQKVLVKRNFFRIYDNQYDDLLQPSDSKIKTYLHLAARSKNPDILKELLEKKLIDVNSVDDLDETPLMEACRFNKIKNVEIFSQVEDIDYLHRNNDGDDALALIKPFVEYDKAIPEIKTKSEYFKALVTLLIQVEHSEDYENDEEPEILDDDGNLESFEGDEDPEDYLDYMDYIDY